MRAILLWHADRNFTPWNWHLTYEGQRLCERTEPLPSGFYDHDVLHGTATKCPQCSANLAAIKKRQAAGNYNGATR